MDFYKRLFSLALILFFATLFFLPSFSEAAFTYEEGGNSIVVSYELPSDVYQEILVQKDMSKWGQLLALSCRVTDDGISVPEASTVLSIPVGAEPYIETAFGVLVGSENSELCLENVSFGTVGYLRSQNIASLLLHPLVLSESGETTGCYRKISVRVSWGTVVKGKDTFVPRTDREPYFEDLFKQSIINYKPAAAAAKTYRAAKEDTNFGNGAVDPGYKFYISEDGIYRITYSELESAGFPVSTVDKNTIKIFFKGQEIPIYVSDESSYYIEFYGVSEKISQYTRTNTYWLTYGGEAALRMETIDGLSSGSSTVDGNDVVQPTSFKTTLHVEDNNFLWSPMPNGEGKDHWFAKRYDTQPVSRTVSLPGIDLSSPYPSAVRVALHGKSSVPLFPDHHDSLKVNGVDIEIDGALWDGAIPHTLEGYVDTVDMLENSVITLASVYTGDIDVKYIDWYEVDYFRKFEAFEDKLVFVGLKTRPVDYTVSGFTNGNIKVFDISDPYDVKRVVIPQGQIVSGSNAYEVKFRRIENQDERLYIAISSGKAMSVGQIDMDTASDLRNKENGADYLVISHSRFIKGIDEPVDGETISFADFRRSQGYRVMVVDVDDVYDEFSYGVVTPDGIKAFIQYAYDNWAAPAPSFVVLVGDASLDYKANYKVPEGDLRTSNLLPTLAVSTKVLGYTPSDNRYACVSGEDLIPDIYIGRFSVTEEAHIKDLVKKIMNYETRTFGDWTTKALLVSSNAQLFRDVNNSIADMIPPGFTVEKQYYVTAPSSINTAISTGALVTNYVGHGGVLNWGNTGGTFYHSNDVFWLSNNDMPTFVVALSCLNGYIGGFVQSAHTDANGVGWRVDTPSLGEAFLLANNNRGAIAVFAASNVGYTGNHTIVDQKLMEEIFKRGNSLLGPAMTNAKILGLASSLEQESVDSFILLGDPATRLKVPVPEQPLAVLPNDAADEVSTMPTLTLSEFSDNFGGTHIGSRFQITRTPGDYSSTVFDMSVGTTSAFDILAEDGNILSIDVPYGHLERGITYYWRGIQYSESGPSTPSLEVSFTVTKDLDGDGYDAISAGGEDCNDVDSSVNPGAEEVYDSIDNNCDGFIDEGFVDNDGDGFAPYSAGGRDCDDNNADIYPGAPETDNGVDSNCDGHISGPGIDVKVPTITEWGAIFLFVLFLGLYKASVREV